MEVYRALREKAKERGLTEDTTKEMDRIVETADSHLRK
jgi:hypothetical protein